MEKRDLNSGLEKWKPGVHKTILLIMAGVIWMGVGLKLNCITLKWLSELGSVHAVKAVFSGIFFSFPIHYFGFRKIVNKNILRIMPMEGKRCFFSFIPWKSYFIIIIMVILGQVLRHSTIPEIYLATLYTAIGTALILSGSIYIKFLIRSVWSDNTDKDS